MSKSSIYYNPNALLSHNRILNFVIGARGIGKSFSFKEFPIKRFLKTGEQFIYLRRYRSELGKVKNYFDDIKFKFPNHKFEVKGRNLLIDDKQFGWAIPLSAWQSEKSNAYPNVTTMVYEEFIREKDNSGYLPNEVNSLLSFMDTVVRDRDNFRCICLSNAITVVNPYFLEFDIVPNINKRFNVYPDIVVEIPDSSDFANHRRKTRFGQLIDGTEYGEMSLDNQFTNDSSLFIEKRTKESRYHFSIVYKGMIIGIWADHKQGLLYMSHDHDPSSKKVFALTMEDIDKNTMLMTSYKSNHFLVHLVKAFKGGWLRYDNQILRNTSYEIFRKMRVQ